MDEPQNPVLTIILGGGRGTRLFPLTQYRCKPAVPLAGTYRLVDIPISNCLDSSALNRGHEHQRSMRRWNARDGRPRRFGGAQRGSGT